MKNGPRSIKSLRFFGLLPVAAIGLAAALQLPASRLSAASEAEREPVSLGGPTTMRRLNEAQYKNSVALIFGPQVKVPGRFEPPLREAGLLAIGDGRAAVSASGVEQYELRARQIAAQVLAADQHAKTVPCTPKDPKAFDKACASAFIGKYGSLLFRRPLAQPESASVLKLVEATANSRQDFYTGLEAGLSRLLNSPNFIFRVEHAVADKAMPGGLRLNDYALATRISFLLWNAPPDAALLEAASAGKLSASGEVERQVDRMIAAPQFEQGVRAFFSDMFAYDGFDGLSKDQAIFPKFNSAVAKSAQEQLLRTIVQLLVTEKGDYRDLFSTRKTYINRPLASLYKVPLPEEAGLDGWVPYTFTEDQHRSGILTLAGFLMLDPSHEGRSSPTIRGKNVRELFLCQPVPIPPPNVNFIAVQNTSDPVHKTARDRLKLHQENPACAGCHAITDPIGLSMENYNALGEYRTHENGALIDASGRFEGKTYGNVIELQSLLRNSPTAPTCAAQRTFEYGVGRPLTKSEQAWLEVASKRFANDGYRFPALMRQIAASKAFRAVAPADPVSKTTTLAFKGYK